MATDIIDGESGGEDGEVGESAAIAAVGVAAGAAIACLSCGAGVVGAYCHACGQKNDDLRRSSLRLARDFIEDTFAFDSRMWRTLALMAARPGLVPANYAHGKRSRYTPPVRLFLVVSFLFFLVLGLTETMFVAMELKKADPKTEGAAVFEIDDRNVECNFNGVLRFFVRPQDVVVDAEGWRRCRETLEAAAQAEILEAGAAEEASAETEQALGMLNRALAGVSLAIENPREFNEDINAWLPRVMILMTPILAFILAVFIRGPNALIFDHLVLSFYSHAVGFTISGAAIIAAQMGLRGVSPFAMGALGLYFIIALKRAYQRGWLKTLWTSAMTGFLYFIILSGIVAAIVSQTILNAP